MAISPAAVLLLWAAADTADQLYRAGLQLFEQGKLDGAQVKLEQAVAARSAHAPSWKALGVVHAAKGDHPLAEPAFRRACALAPALPDACFYHGRVLYLLNRFDDSLGILRPLAAADPRAHRVIALSLEALGRWREAEAEFLTAIRLRPRGEDARIDYAVALMRQGRAQDALAPLQASLKDVPDSARAHLELGRAFVQLDRPNDALPPLQRAVQLDPKSAPAHLLLGKVYIRLGQPDKAQPHLRQGAGQ